MTIHLTTLQEAEFAAEEVHLDKDRRSIRSYNLRKAMKLGNLYKRRVKVYFKTLKGELKKVEATVWAVGDQYVSFRGGITIPIHSIQKVEF